MSHADLNHAPLTGNRGREPSSGEPSRDVHPRRQHTSLAIQLTCRDKGIILSLTRILLATASQISRTWWVISRSPYTCAYYRLEALVHAGFLVRVQVRTHPELILDRPVWSWTPGNPTPPFGRLSYQLRTRWTEPPRPTTVYVASESAARRYAGAGGLLPRPLQVRHDLHVAAIYLRLLRDRPEEAANWVSESVLAPLRRGQKLPDAEIHDAHGRPIKVIEFGGSYSPERLQKVHADCERRQLPYELW